MARSFAFAAAAILAVLGILASTDSLAQTGRVLQISTRAQVLTGDDVVIAGFIIGGTTPKTVVINVAGPSLASLVALPLRDPNLALVRQSDGATLKTNDNWQAQGVPGDLAALVASGFEPGDTREPAIIATLPPGAYTAIVSGAGASTGVAVVGVFEVDNPASPLINIAGRAKVLTGDNVLIAGFAVGPADPRTVVVKVAGPSLFGLVPDPLRNPELTLVRMSDSTVIATNDDWQVQANPADVAALQASGLQPDHASEPAIIATLPPGNYTAIARGVSGGTGIAVLSVFHANRDLAISSANTTTFTVGTAGTFTVTTEGSPPATSVNAAGPLPAGVIFTPGTTTGTFSGTPAAGTGGTYPITIVAANGTPQSATQNFTLVVNQAPAITSANAATFNVGTAGSHTVVASGFPAPTLSVAGALPAGVTFNAGTGALSGTPAAGTAGSYPITFTATNGVLPNATQSFTLTVTDNVAITSANTTTFTVGAAGTFTVTTAGTPAATSVTATGALPSGVSFTPGTTTGTLSGTPGAGTGGTYTLTITASNGIPPNATQTFTFVVNEAPTITSVNAATFQLGSAGTHTVIATGFPAPTLSVTGALPAGVTFNPATGALSGTPAAGTAGSYPLVFTAANGVGANATQNFTLTVNQTVTVTSANAATFTVGQAGTFTITTSATPVANNITITGALPAGVTLGATSGTGTAVLSGTPNAGTGGTYNVTITASNGGVTPNGTQSFTLTVNEAPGITSANATTFTVGTAGTFTVTATGFPASTFSATGALPAGVTLTPAGVLQGTPAAGTGGAYPIVITAANGTLPNATQNFTLTVNQAPAITSAPAATFTVAGAPGSHTFTTSGFPASAIGVVGALPGGVTVVGNLLSGTPVDGTGGTYALTVTATNGVAPNAVQSFTLTVNESPTITSANNATFQVGVAATPFTVTADGFPVSTFTTPGPLPAGVTLAANGTLSGTPGAGSAGVYPIVITAANGVLPNGTQAFTLTVNDPANAVDDTFATVHDTPLVVAAPGVLGNDTGTPAPTVVAVNGSGANVGVATPTANGSVTLNADGSGTYTPNANYAGPDTFTYTVQNTTGTDTATVTINVTNALPVIDLDGAAGPTIDVARLFTEGAGAIAIVDPAQLTVTDADDTNLTGAIVSITNIQNAGAEILGFTCPSLPGSCSGAIQVADVSYNGGTGELTIAANAPLADYQALLRTVTYNNTSLAPVGTPRVIEFEVNDGIAVNNPIAVSTVTLAGANDPPVITAPNTTPATALPTPVNTALVFSGNVSVADPDAGTSNVQVTLTATNGTMTLAATAGLTVAGNGTANVTATGPLTNLNAALNGMSFNPTAAYSGAATLVIGADDLGNTGSGGALTATHTVHINVDNRPTVTTTIPVNAASAVSSASTITVNFSENVTVTGASFTINCTPSGVRPFSFSGSGTSTVILTPNTALPAGESCTVTVVAAQVTDSIAQTMAADHVFSFTVNTLPTVTTTVPANAATGIQLAANVTVNFSEAVNATAASFTMSCPTSGAHTFGLAGAGTASIVLDPTTDFSASEVCTVTAVAAQITDVDGGQNMAANHVFSFTIGTPPAITSANAATFTVGQAGTHTVTTTGAPTASSIVMASVTPGPGGALPTGVAFNYGGGATATLSGAATNASHVGAYVLSFTASNGITPDAVQNPFTLTLQCPTITLGPASGSTFAATYNTLFTQAFTPAGGTPPYTYVVGGTALPSVAFSGNNLTGTPNNTGSFAFTAQAVDSFGCTSATQNYTLNVNPAAGNDAYDALGNVLVDSSTGPGTPFTVISNDSFPGAGTTLISAFDATSVNGGTVTMTTAAGPNLGRFTYNPPVGYTGTDTFTYTLSSNGRTAVGTVTFTIAGKIWFINGAGGACPVGPCNGRMTHPFVDTAAFQAVNGTGVAPNPTNNDPIFVHSAVYAGGPITLRNGQRLIGQAASAGQLATLANVTVQNGQTLPATAGATPVLNGAVTLGQSNFIHGLTLSGNTALSGTNFGTLTLNDNVTISTTGAGLNLATGTANATFSSVGSSGGTNNVNLSAVAGTLDLGTGALSGATGNAFNVTGGAATITYGGTIASSGARSVAIASKTGGTVTFNGAITDNVTGISLTNNTGATIAFTGALTLSTGASTAFNATGGGTLTSTSAASTVTTTTATAVNVSGTAIGASGLRFRSISSNGGATGIVLSDTGAGPFTVTGTGGAGSGGTIQNKTGRGASFITAQNVSLTSMNFTNTATSDLDADNSGLTTGDNLVTNAAIHLQYVTNATLDGIAISGSAEQGINGHFVTNFALRNSSIAGAGNGPDEDGIHFYNMLGTSEITNTTITSSGDDNINIQNNTPGAHCAPATCPAFPAGMTPVTTLTITGGSANTGVLGSGYLMGIRGASNTTVTVNGVTANNNLSGGIVIDTYDTATSSIEITGVTSTNNNDAISMSSHNGNTKFDIHDNVSFAGTDFGRINILKSAFSTSGTLQGKIRNNPIVVSNGQAADGIFVFHAGGGTLAVAITGNTIDYAGTQRAILLQGGQDGAAQLHATVTGNAIDIELDGAGNAATGILAQVAVASPSGDGSFLCADIGGAGALANVFTHSLGGNMAAGDIRVRQRFDTGVRLPGYGGGNSDNAAVVSYLAGRNTLVNSPTATATNGIGVDTGADGYVGGAACTQPVFP